eukprot:scaffold269_cov404-Prasinococcus_capsulatus_cf.AAC.34
MPTQAPVKAEAAAAAVEAVPPSETPKEPGGDEGAPAGTTEPDVKTENAADGGGAVAVKEEEEPSDEEKAKQEELQKRKQEAAKKKQEEDLLAEFFDDVHKAARDAEVVRILSCFKPNPYEFLNVNFDAEEKEINRAFRKVSLLVHPDKNKHERAKEAFEALQLAHKQLKDEGFMKGLRMSLEEAQKNQIKEWKQKWKKDRKNEGKEKDERDEDLEAYKASKLFHIDWRRHARELITHIKWTQRKLGIRQEEEEERLKEADKEVMDKMKRIREHEKEWEETREVRMDSWRDFQTKKKSKTVGETKAPKMKEEDDEHTFIQRPVQRDFRRSDGV